MIINHMNVNRREFMKAAGFVAAAGGELFTSRSSLLNPDNQKSSKIPKIAQYKTVEELSADPDAVYVHPGVRVRSSKDILYTRLSKRAEDGVHNIVLAWSSTERHGIFCSIKFADNPSQLTALQFAYQDIDKAQIIGIRKHLPAEMPPRIIEGVVRGFGYQNINDINLGTETRHSETIAFDTKLGAAYIFRDNKPLTNILFDV